MSIGEKIVKTAESFVGQEEVRGNLGFKDEEFQELMEAVGWEKNQAWCAYFAELVWKLSFTSNQNTVRELNLLFSAGAVATWNQFRRSEWITSDSPRVGAVIIWQTYKSNKPYWTGHIGIVTKIEGTAIHTIEGNTNPQGGREGYTVSKKVRVLNPKVKDGLRFKGCIYPEKAII